IALAGRLLVMQPVLNFVFTRRSASIISGRKSPDNSGSTSLPRTAAPSTSDSAANSRSKASTSTSARSNFAQAFSRWLAALVRRIMPAGSPRAVSNRAKASNGEVVSTPPKSQITASIATSNSVIPGRSVCAILRGPSEPGIQRLPLDSGSTRRACPGMTRSFGWSCPCRSVHRHLDGGESRVDMAAHVRMREHVELLFANRREHAPCNIGRIEPGRDTRGDLSEHLAGRTCRIRRLRLAIAPWPVAAALADPGADEVRTEHAHADAMRLELLGQTLGHADHRELS